MNLQFDEDQVSVQPSSIERSSRTPRLVQLVINLGLAKTKEQANYILLGLIGVLIVIIVVSLSSLQGGEPNPNEVDPDFYITDG